MEGIQRSRGWFDLPNGPKPMLHRYAARAAWGKYFRDYDAFLMPVDFVPAFPHDHTPDQNVRVLQTPEGPRRYTDQIFWPSFAIMTGLPATAAPVGLTKDGLPVGVQILGPWLEDATPIFISESSRGKNRISDSKGIRMTAIRS